MCGSEVMCSKKKVYPLVYQSQIYGTWYPYLNEEGFKYLKSLEVGHYFGFTMWILSISCFVYANRGLIFLLAYGVLLQWNSFIVFKNHFYQKKCVLNGIKG